ncbi:MAG: hypothetical protein OEY49_15665, partial [Candidatus Heimdallarchaeota archaeon]|nr:hypothetical protein [Candidatus Heimdallarchaeota archaeon]
SISFDYLTNLVSIKNPKQSKNANTRIITETGDQIVDIKSESEIVQSAISRECAYCGEKAVVAQAQFCIGCGASLSSAK